jgi:uncharacterized membrane protein
MSRCRTIIVSLALVGLLLLTVGGTAAKGGGGGHGHKKSPQARLTWGIARVERTVAPGQTIEVNVTLTSSANLNNVVLRVPGGLGRVLKVEPASFASLKAGVAAPVKLTITLPAAGAHSQGGIVQVRAGQRNVPAALKIKLTVPGSTGDDDDDD